MKRIGAHSPTVSPADQNFLRQIIVSIHQVIQAYCTVRGVSRCSLPR